MKKPTSIKLGRISAAVSVGLLLAGGLSNLHAAVRTWDGGGGVNWSDVANWDGDTSAPVNGDDLVFDGTVGLTNYNDIGGDWLSITFAPTAGQFLLQGDTAMRMGTGGNAGVTNSSANVQTIDIETKNNRATTYDTTGADMVFTKRLWDWRYYKVGPNDLISRQTISGYNGQVLGITGGRIVFNPMVGGPIGHGMAINDGGTLVTLGPEPSFTANGDRRADAVMFGGLWQVQNTNSVGDPYFERVCMLRGDNPAAVLENGAAYGPVELQVGYGNGARVGAFDGTIQDGSGGGALALRVTNSVTYSYWRLGGTSSYSGDTSILSGNTNATSETRLIINGSHTGGGDYLVQGDTNSSKAYLGGAGSIAAGTVNVGVNGALSPGGDLEGASLYAQQGGGNPNTGTFAESPGTLTIDGVVTLDDATSTLDITLAGAIVGEYDQLAIIGSGLLTNNNANLDLTVALSFAPSEGDQFTIVDVAGTSVANNFGVFASLNGVVTDLSQGAQFTIGGVDFSISYRAEGTTFDAGAGNGNNIMLEVQADTSAKLAWRGDVNSDWDVSGTANWRDTNNVATTFTNLSRVTFDDSGVATSVNLTTDLNPKSILVDASQDYNFGGFGKLTGVLSMTKTNTGTLVMTTDNDFDGSTTIEGGTVQVGDGGAAGILPGVVVITANGTLEHNRTDSQAVSEISGEGVMVHSGSGTLLVTNDLVDFTGTVSNKTGIFQVGDSFSNNGSLGGTVDVSSGSTLQYYYLDADKTIANLLSGSGTVMYDLAAEQRTYTIPNTFVNSNFNGTHIIGPFVRLYAQDSNDGYIFGDGGTVIVENYAQAYMDRSATTYNQDFILRSRSWGVDETGDRLGGIRAYRATISGSVTLEIDSIFGGNCDGLTISGPIIGGIYGMEINQNNPSTLVLSLSNSNNAWGTTLIASGGLRSLVTGSISSGGMTITNGYLDTYGTTVSVNSLSGTGTVYNNSSSEVGTIAIGADGSTGQFDGTFSDGDTQPLGVTKAGAGTLTLTAASDNTGTVAVEGGTLALSGSGSFANAGAFAVATGGTLDVTGATGTLALNSGQTLRHSGASTGPITVSGNVNIGTGTLLLGVNRAGLASDSLAASGTVTYSGTLAVANTGAALEAGDKFQLFPGAVAGFSSYDLQAYDLVNNVQYTWQNDVAVDGSVTVLTALPYAGPTLGVSQSGNDLTFTWDGPFVLQSETNELSVGLSTNWFDYPGGDSSPVNVTIDPANPTVFFRLSE